MNKEIQVLHTIFELELAPPFELVGDPNTPNVPDIYNKYSEKFGWYDINAKRFYLQAIVEKSLLTKIKRTFNVDPLSSDDIYHVIKHLHNWLQDKFSEEIKIIKFVNRDTWESVIYQPQSKFKNYE